METLIVKAAITSEKNRQRFDYLVELLRALPEVEVEPATAPPAHENGVPARPILTPAERAQAEADFWALAGLWEGRDIDGDELRRRAWQRGNSGL